MLDENSILYAASALRSAEATRTPTRQLSQLYPSRTIEDAYAVQGAGG